MASAGTDLLGYLGVASQLSLEQIYCDHSKILLPNEFFLAGYQHGRDTELFSNQRVVSIDIQGIIGKKTTVIRSISYKWITSFTVCSQGLVDLDQELILQTVGAGGSHTIKLATNVDLGHICKIITTCVCQSPSAKPPIDPAVFAPPESKSKGKGFIGKILSVGSALDPAELQKTHGHLFVPGETVLIGFQHGRDTDMFTNVRLISVDVQGLSGKSVKVQSFSYQMISSWNVTTAGMADHDAEIEINMKGWTGSKKFNVKASTNVFEVQKILGYFCVNIVKGSNCEANQIAVSAARAANKNDNKSDAGKGFLGTIASVAVELPLSDVQQEFSQHLLQGEVFFAGYRHGRDTELFTSFRHLSVDVTGITGKSTRVSSTPYTSITSWNLTSAGFLDADSELTMVTEGDVRARKINLTRSISTFELQKLLAAKCCDMTSPTCFYQPSGTAEAMMSAKQGAGQGFLGVLGSVASAVPLDEVQKSHGGLLLQGESFIAAYRHGRDAELFTNFRVIGVDVTGVLSNETSITSIPYTQISAWSVSSQGFVDFDCDLHIFGRGGTWPRHINLDKKIDVFGVQKILATYCAPPTAAAFINQDHAAEAATAAADAAMTGNKIGGGLLGLLGIASAVPVSTLVQEHGRLLIPGEAIIAGYAHGRDSEVFTTNRVVSVDVRGLGAKVAVTSYPWTQVATWAISSQGFLDLDADMSLSMNASSVIVVRQGDKSHEKLVEMPPFAIEVNRSTNIFNVQKMFAQVCTSNVATQWAASGSCV